MTAVNFLLAFVLFFTMIYHAHVVKNAPIVNFIKQKLHPVNIARAGTIRGYGSEASAYRFPPPQGILTDNTGKPVPYTRISTQTNGFVTYLMDESVVPVTVATYNPETNQITFYPKDNIIK